LPAPDERSGRSGERLLSRLQGCQASKPLKCRHFETTVWIVRPSYIAAYHPARFLTVYRGHDPVLYKCASVGTVRRPDANPIVCFHHDRVQRNLVIAREQLTKQQPEVTKALRVNDAIDHPVVVRPEVISQFDVAARGQRENCVLICGARRGGAVIRLGTEHAKFLDSASGRLSAGECCPKT